MAARGSGVRQPVCSGDTELCVVSTGAVQPGDDLPPNVLSAGPWPISVPFLMDCAAPGMAPLVSEHACYDAGKMQREK